MRCGRLCELVGAAWTEADHLRRIVFRAGELGLIGSANASALALDCAAALDFDCGDLCWEHVEAVRNRLRQAMVAHSWARSSQ